jgi:hypothetical protein
MTPRTSRWLALPLFLGLAGIAVAKPPSPGAKPGVSLPKLPSTWAKQIIHTTSKALVKPKLELMPDFGSVQQMTPADKAAALETTAAEVQGPLTFSARRTYVDDRHWFDVDPANGGMVLRASRNYILMNPPSTGGSQPNIELHFTAAANHRYLLECTIDVQSGVAQTIIARDGSATEYSVNLTAAKATLMYRLQAAPTSREMTVQIAGTTATQWYFEGCELSWTNA